MKPKGKRRRSANLGMEQKNRYSYEYELTYVPVPGRCNGMLFVMYRLLLQLYIESRVLSSPHRVCALCTTAVSTRYSKSYLYISGYQ